MNKPGPSIFKQIEKQMRQRPPNVTTTPRRPKMAQVEVVPPPRPFAVQFRLGLSNLSATGTFFDYEHRHVLRVTIVRSLFDRVLIAILLLLPLILQSFFKKIWPGYFLPSTVVLKKLKPDWDDEFENEKYIYKRLEYQQGRLVPVLYGEGRCDETRVLILSYIDGVRPFEQKPPVLRREDFKQRLEAAYQELGVLGLSHDDPKLDNFLIVDDRIALVDLESVADPGSDLEHVISSYVLHVMDQYDSFLKRQA
ncbi:hypothetical protein BGZ61DRAFT_431711 [Ilyonectria robusta]|uniref:uncharacterized protein n=1 Tax=Ilyonectria robusta TaxID=1079257 RepID=UPI001E8D2B4D|nr:uncharacterized protein BGZ61DRAFT_431711 [Ilyonectria robusta]KAH8663751.1 hypothetical protein BGZ61DRAFT_431711 [Ilyonectria robusta]